MRNERLILNELMNLNESLSSQDKKEILKVYPNLKNFSKLDAMESGFLAIEKSKLTKGAIVYDNDGRSGEYDGSNGFYGSSATLDHFAMGKFVLINPTESKVVSKEAELTRDAWLAMNSKGGTATARLQAYADKVGITLADAKNLAKYYDGKAPKKFRSSELRALAKHVLGL